MSIQIVQPDGEQRPAAEPSLPEALPVLPLRDIVPFPDTLTPLAIGQERSIRLVNDVLGGDRMLAMVASRQSEVEPRGPSTSTTSGWQAPSRACSRCQTARFAFSFRPARASG